MGLSAAELASSMAALAAIEPGFAAALASAGPPEPRRRQPGYATLLRTIVGQQVSVAAAAAVWARLEAALGADCPPDAVLAASPGALRACGLSAQKQGYARSLAEEVTSGALALDALPGGDEAAIAALTRVKGIGRWSAEIYLLFAEGRADIWPAGDLAVQAAIGGILSLPARPDERALRALAEPWRPHRGAAAIFAWHYYSASRAPVGG